ncbi:MAG TPA: gluconokinase [Gemmatimonadaceae bacterium]
MVVILMGPAGSGKTTIGRRLAGTLGWPYHEGDDFHPPENVALMRAGTALGDAERAPWLAALAGVVARCVEGDTSAVIACSALKRAYRRALVPDGAPAAAVRFVYLRATPALLAERLGTRQGHYFTAALLESQLAALEAPGDGEPAPVLTVDASMEPDALVREIRRGLGA